MIDPTKAHELDAFKYDRPLLCVRWSPNGEAIYFSAENRPPQRFTPAAGKVKPAVSPLAGGHDSWVWSLAVLPDAKTVVTAGYDGRLVWFDTAPEQPTVKHVRDAHRGWVRGVAASPDGRLVASCGNDRLVRIWDATDATERAVLAGHESDVYELAWRPDGATLASCDHRGIVKEWDVAKAAVRRDVITASPLWKKDATFRAEIGGARSICFNTDGSILALGGITDVTNAFAGVGKPVIVLVDWTATRPAEDDDSDAAFPRLRQLRGKGAGNGVCWGVAWHPAGFWIGQAGGGGGGWLRFFKADADVDFHAVKLPTTARGMALSPDGSRVALAMADGHLRVYALHG